MEEISADLAAEFGGHEELRAGERLCGFERAVGSNGGLGKERARHTYDKQPQSHSRTVPQRATGIQLLPRSYPAKHRHTLSQSARNLCKPCFVREQTAFIRLW